MRSALQEGKFQLSDSLFRSLFESSSFPMVLAYRDSGNVEFNAAAQKYSWLNFLTPDILNALEDSTNSGTDFTFSISHLDFEATDFYYRRQRVTLAQIKGLESMQPHHDPQFLENIRTLVEHTPDILFSLNLDGKLLSANRAFYTLFQEVTGSLPKTPEIFISDYLPVETRQKLAQLLTKITENKRIDFVAPVDFNDHTKYFDIACTPIIRLGRVTGAAFSAHETSEIFVASRAVKDYRYLFNESPLAKFLLDVEGWKFEDVNEEALNLYGYSREEFLNLDPTDIVHSDDRGLMMDLRPRMATEKVIKAEIRHVTKSGITRDIEFTCHLVYVDNKPKRLTVANDITGRREVENALMESQIRFSAFMTNIPALACIKDSEGHLVYINKMFSELFNTSPVEAIGKTDFEIMPIETAMLCSATDKEVLETGQDKEFIQNIQLGDGSEKYYLISKFRIQNNNNGAAYIGSLGIDITDKRLAEEKLVEYTANLEQMNQALREANEKSENSLRIKEQFLANMSHEIRTPMNAIIGLTRLVLSTNLTPEQSEYLKTIKRSGQTLMVIINDILDLSKIEAGKMLLENIVFDLRETIEFTYALLRPRALEKGIDLKYTLAPNVPEHIVGDPVRLNQILMNLAANAIKFTETGSVSLSVNISRKIKNQPTLVFAVTDTGIGIPKDRMESIFDSFTQASVNTTRHFGGTGLGLTIVKKLVELQNGRVSVESVEGKGSTFSFELPLLTADNSIPVETNPDSIAHSNIFKGCRALLVEDNTLNQLVARKILERFGLEVDTADNGKDAIELFSHEEYHIILMDIQMHEMDGYETTQLIRSNFGAKGRKVPILAMTAFAVSGEAERCIEKGMNDYISKPFDAENLYMKLTQLLKKKSDTRTPKKHPKKEDHMINLQYLRDLADGDSSFIQKTIGMFLETVPQCLNDIEKNLSVKNWRQIQLLAHKIRPSLGIIGVPQGQDILRKIEHCARDEQNPQKVSNMLQELRVLLGHCSEELKQELVR